MKQHITREQLQELTETQKLEERTLSIGQMIELLEDNTNDFGIHYMDTTGDYLVYLGHFRDTAKHTWVCDELCDALFEAVKAVRNGGS